MPPLRPVPGFGDRGVVSASAQDFNFAVPGTVVPPVNRSALLGVSRATQLSDAIAGQPMNGLQQDIVQARSASPLAPQQTTGANLSIARPLSGLLSGIAQTVRAPFQHTFTDQAGIRSRANQLAAEQVTDEMTEGEVAVIQESALAQAQQEAEQGNAKAFGAVAGLRAAQEGVNIALTHRAVKDELNNIQRDTERFINGVEFNAKLTEQAQNLQAMKNNLRIMDSILQQTGPIRSGRQQQTFARNPISGNLV